MGVAQLWGASLSGQVKMTADCDCAGGEKTWQQTGERMAGGSGWAAHTWRSATGAVSRGLWATMSRNQPWKDPGSSISGRGNRKCKGPEAGTCLFNSRKREYEGEWRGG